MSTIHESERHLASETRASSSRRTRRGWWKSAAIFVALGAATACGSAGGSASSTAPSETIATEDGLQKMGVASYRVVVQTGLAFQVAFQDASGADIGQLTYDAPSFTLAWNGQSYTFATGQFESGRGIDRAMVKPLTLANLLGVTVLDHLGAASPETLTPTRGTVPAQPSEMSALAVQTPTRTKEVTPGDGSLIGSFVGNARITCYVTAANPEIIPVEPGETYEVIFSYGTISCTNVVSLLSLSVGLWESVGNIDLASNSGYLTERSSLEVVTEGVECISTTYITTVAATIIPPNGYQPLAWSGDINSPAVSAQCTKGGGGGGSGGGGVGGGGGEGGGGECDDPCEANYDCEPDEACVQGCCKISE